MKADLSRYPSGVDSLVPELLDQLNMSFVTPLLCLIIYSQAHQ